MGYKKVYQLSILFSCIADILFYSPFCKEKVKNNKLKNMLDYYIIFNFSPTLLIDENRR